MTGSCGSGSGPERRIREGTSRPDLSMFKWQSTRTKMHPVLDELLRGNVTSHGGFGHLEAPKPMSPDTALSGIPRQVLWLARGTVPDNQLTRAVLDNYNAARSGNIYVVFNSGWFISDYGGLSLAATPGSPWRYDTYVPILFAGHGIKPQTVSRRVHTVDVSTTLATAIGTRPPSGAAGEVLLEVLGQ